ncbi:hypothetical protein [Amycolatopsis saalfeldensis]|uniref:hypothetical protein n=1 Tax=Amycolatopsis saalfeldensis TaxID=394193 RepID=UPI0011603D09|nr:hypothetical protein [Amycolatopsis saalfeldensis]
MEQTPPRPRRRAANEAARAAFQEARQAGLVRRHLLKLRYLADHPRTAEDGLPAENSDRVEAQPSPEPTRRQRRRAKPVQPAFDFTTKPAPKQSTSDAEAA